MASDGLSARGLTDHSNFTLRPYTDQSTAQFAREVFSLNQDSPSYAVNSIVHKLGVVRLALPKITNGVGPGT